MIKQFSDEHFPPEIQQIADSMNVEKENIPAWNIPDLPFGRNCSPLDFIEKKRKQLLQPFYQQIYGNIPPRCESVTFKTISEGPAFQGLAVRRQIDICCQHRGMTRILHLLLYIPAAAVKPVPVFFGLNFTGNHATTEDPGVTFHPFTPYPALIPGSLRWTDNRVGEDKRGVHQGRWNMEKVLRRGYASATMCFHDIYPDHPHGFQDSIMRFFYTEKEWNSPERDTGAISAWVWGMQRGMDCLEAQRELDMSRLFIHGLSRLGKTSLWCGANDPRPALIISNCAGACGDKLMHHYYGENFAWLHYWNAHFFRGNFAALLSKEMEIPFDFHFLLAAVAPRRLLITAADEDVYADPEGQFASCIAASSAWKLFGGTGLGTEQFPSCGNLTGKEIGFYLRHGGHGTEPEDWDAILKYTDQCF